MHSRFITLLCLSGLPTLAAAQPPVFKVVVEEAQLREASATLTLVGTVRPVRRSRVGAEIDGLLAELPTREGDYIEAEGTIGRLDAEPLQLRLQQEQARLASLEAMHEELVNGTRPEELRRLEALYNESVAELERWSFEMERIERLFGEGQSNAKEFQDTQASYRAAQRRKIALEAAYELGREGPRQEEISRAAADVAEQKAVVAQIERDLKKATIRAPFAGYVVQRHTEVGEWIDTGDAIVEMVDLSSVLVRVDLPEVALAHARVGEPVLVKVDALKRTFTGRIKHIVREADPDARTFPIDVEIENETGELAGGMFARAMVPAGPKEDVVAVPKDAIVEREGITYVGVVMPGRGGGLSGMLRPVTLGADLDEWIGIRSGNVGPGEKVIVRGNELMHPFPMGIEIVDEKGTPVAMPDFAHQDEERGGA